jgi:hypothetical protein
MLTTVLMLKAAWFAGGAIFLGGAALLWKASKRHKELERSQSDSAQPPIN